MGNWKSILVGGVILGLGAVGCGPASQTTPDAGTPDAGSELVVPEVYAFASRGDANTSSVSYSGQTFRHVLIEEMKNDIGRLTADIDQGLTPAEGDIAARLNFYFEFDGNTSGDVPLTLTTTPETLQATYGAISGGAKLVDKIAGNDAVGQHKDWSTQFRGWQGASSPEVLVRGWFDELDALAVARANGNVPVDPSGAAISKVFVTEDGRDLQQLLQKFLTGAVAFSQGADDYLDDDIEGKGLLADNTELVSGKSYTELEHQWDEGFGYFGASRDYAGRTDDEVASTPGFDTNGDGKIDLTSEYSFGHSGNASKRDRGSSDAAPTDFSDEAIRAFLKGRAIISAAEGALTAEELEALKDQRDIAVLAWEKAIASTVVHYINDVLADMNKFGTENYKFLDHAKHWSEMKGFALSLQFNPRSPLGDTQFEQLHQKLGDAPVLPNGMGIDAYKTALREARALLKDAYGFHESNMGDDNGENGW